MVETDANKDVWAGLETAIEAVERGYDEYQTQLLAWSQDRRKQLDRQTAVAEERASATARELEEHAQQLAHDQDTLAQNKAELERFRVELNALAEECGRRERASREREGLLDQKFSLHEATAASLLEREKKLDQQQCELQGRFEKSQREFEVRESTLVGAEKAIAEQRIQLDHDHKELAHSRDELARRERELASHSTSNDETRQKLAQLSAELDARQRNLKGENDELSTRRSQIDCRAEELASLESQLQSRIAEIDGRALSLDADSQRLKEQSELLANRERELEQTEAKCTAEHQKAAHDLEQREREHADATRALSARAKGLEIAQGEIEARQQALQTASREHQRREKELTETERKYAKRQPTFEEAENRLRAGQKALQAERDELETMRKSVEADLAAKREKSARSDAESQACRHQVEQDIKSVEQRAQALDRRSQEIERISQKLAEREGELNRHQAKLEKALQGLRDDQNAVEKARSSLTEVDESRLNELNKVRAELNAMRTENESARARARELEGSLGLAQAANAREIHAGENARETVMRLTKELENEKRVAAEQRAAIFAKCLTAAGHKGPSADGEHDVFALLEGIKAKSGGLSPNLSDGGTLLVQRQKSHTGVATFWADFKLAPPPAGPATVDSSETRTGAADVAVTASGAASLEDVGAQVCASVEAAGTRASAMQTALAAARAEVEAAKHNESGAARSGSKTKSASSGKKRKASNTSVQRQTALTPGSEPAVIRPGPAVASIDLDPETANKLRMLRRLNPTKSDQELLTKIAAEAKFAANTKPKKGWFALR